MANLCREKYAAELEELMVCTPRRRDVLVILPSICVLANEPELEEDVSECGFVRYAYVINTKRDDDDESINTMGRLGRLALLCQQLVETPDYSSNPSLNSSPVLPLNSIKYSPKSIRVPPSQCAFNPVFSRYPLRVCVRQDKL